MPKQKKKSKRTILKALKQRRTDPHGQNIKRSTERLRLQSKRLNPSYRCQEKQYKVTRNTLIRKRKPGRMQEQFSSSCKRIRLNTAALNTLASIEDDSDQFSEIPNLDAKSNEQSKETKRKAILRKNVVFRLAEKLKDKARRTLSRMNAEKRAAEQVKDTTRHAETRKNTAFRANEKAKDATRRKCLRKILDVRCAEKIKDAHHRALRRQITDIRISERVVDAERRSLARTNPVVRTNESNKKNAARQLRCQQKSYELEIVKFRYEVKHGPSNVCTCCGGLWFYRQVRPFDVCYFSKKFTEEFAEKISLAPSNPSMICRTCYKHSNQGNIPKLSMSNGFSYPPIPPELCNLTVLEERLVAARIPFMIIISLGIDQQCGLRGNIVNIWNPINNLATVLPRTYSESSTIQLAFMRKMAYTHPYLCESIRPYVVYRAAKYLVNTPLYQQENIALSEEWEHLDETDTKQFVASPEDLQQVEKVSNFQQSQELPALEDNSDTNEDDSEVLPSEEVTMLHEENLNVGIRYAPGEGQTPMSLLSDDNAELLSFPAIYGGEPRHIEAHCKASYTDIVRSEARRFDRRSCTPVHLLYQYKRLQIINIHSAINISLRKRQMGTSTAADMLRSEYVNNLIQHDDGYKFLRGIKSSPAYWEKQQKKVLAMIRQLGMPTFFVTLSAAESRWQELIIILANVLDNKALTETDVVQMSLAERNAYIRRDPVTCARYFDHRFRSLYNHLFASGAIFEEFAILDFYWRIEFQHRGSPHVHMILWLKNAPVFDPQDKQSFQICSRFIDRFVTCENDEILATYQSHRHSFTCWKKSRSGKVCRFGIPVPPMRQTVILEPHSERNKDAQLLDKQNLEKLKSFLVIVRQQRLEIEFDQFLEHLELTETDYMNAIKSSIRHSTVFLKRNPGSAYINAYNCRIEDAWKANMDIQFILDAYACAKYVVQYINKSCRGVSKLIREAAEDIRLGNLSIREKLRKFGNCITNGTEVSAQEAAYGVLGMQMVLSSRADIFVPTSAPEDRVFLIKSDSELAKLDPDSVDIAVPNILNHYMHRPDDLDETCLASFSAWYEYVTRIPTKVSNDTTEDENVSSSFPNAFGQTNEFCSRYLKLKQNKGYVRRRIKAKIIRFRNYSHHSESANYYREQCMLYWPWRNEDSDLLKQNCENIYNKNSEQIHKNKVEFQPSNCLDVMIEREAAALLADDDDVMELPVIIDDEYRPFFDTTTTVDSFQNQSSTEATLGQFPVPSRVADSTYIELANSLNSKQRQYFTHVMRNVSSCSKNMYEFVAGGAGVGKTHLIKTIVQWLIRHQLSIAGTNPLLSPVLLCAPTGKAAFHIKGVTLHAAFSLPLNQKKLGPLDFSKLNTLRTNLQNVKLIIMDEVSMCSSRMLQFIDSRLQQIFDTTEPFGGKYCICFGDLHQLRPVGGSYVFQANKDDVSVIAGAYPWQLFKYFELTQIMRQNNAVFAQALNNLAIGNLTPNEVGMFESREISDNLHPPAETIRLFNSNSSVDMYNTIFLNNLQTEAVISEATDMVNGATSLTSKSAILKAAQQKSIRDTLGLPRVLVLKIGAKYMVTNNLDTSDGLVNGATGVLMDIKFGSQHNPRMPKTPMLLLMDFKDLDVGNKTRRMFNLQGVLTPISPIVREIHRWPSNNSSVNRRQFPVVPAHALTFWKAQGMTYDSVVIKTCASVDRQQLYVACSRVTTLEGLYFDGKFLPPRNPRMDDPVETELARLRTYSNISFNSADIPQTCATRRKIMYHNVQSFLLHRNSIQTNELYTQCDVLLFAEPKIKPGDMCEMPNYRCKYILHSSGDRRNSTGLLVFAKPEVNISVEYSIQSNCKCEHAEIVVLKLASLIIILGYKSPRMSLGLFQEMIVIALSKFPEQRILVVGDFNVNANHVASNAFLARLLQKGLVTALPRETSSNNSGTLIDYCVTNDNNIEAQFTESGFSYHRPMIISIRHE